MSIEISCQECGESCRIASKFGGKRIRCPQCREPLNVPAIDADQSRKRTSAKSAAKKTAASKSAKKESSQPRDDRRARRARESKELSPPPRRSTRSSGASTRKSAKKSKSNSVRSPLLIPMAIGGGVLAVGLFGFMAFKLGQSNQSTDRVATTTPAVLSDVSELNEPVEQADQAKAEPSQSPAIASLSTNPDSTPSGQSAKTTPAFDPSAFSDSAMASTDRVTDGQTGEKPDATPVTRTPAVERTLPELIAMIEPSVVRIDVRTAEGLGNGSGFIVDDKGTVVTNYHVIAGGQNATAMLSDKTKVRVLGYTYIDPKRDIAILKIDIRGSKFPALKLIDDPPLKGEGVVALGAPFGLDSTASEGIVSSSRTAAELENTLGLTDHAGTWIQTTTPISPGNSGGPLVNRKGKVVAINTMTLTIGQNLNFGISAMDIRSALSKQSAPKSLSPVSVPELAAQGSGKPKIVDIVGTPQADTYFGRIKKVRVLMLAFAADPTGVVVNSVRTEAIKALETADVQLGSNTSEALMFVAMSLSRSGGAVGAQQLRVTTTIHFQDETSASPKVYKIWESTGTLGTLSLQSLLRGVLPRRLGGEVKKHFKELRGEFKRGQAKVQDDPSL